MGYGGTPYVGLVFALSLSRCSCWLWRCVSSVMLSRFLRAGVQLCVGGVGFVLLCLVNGFGFFFEEVVVCLFSPVEHGGSHGCLLPAIEDSTRCLLFFVVRVPTGCFW